MTDDNKQPTELEMDTILSGSHVKEMVGKEIDRDNKQPTDAELRKLAKETEYDMTDEGWDVLVQQLLDDEDSPNQTNYIN